MCKTHNNYARNIVLFVLVALVLVAAIFAFTVANGSAKEEGEVIMNTEVPMAPAPETETPAETAAPKTKKGSVSSKRQAKAEMLAQGMEEEAHIDVAATSAPETPATLETVTQADVDNMSAVETLELVEKLAEVPETEMAETIEVIPAIKTEKVIEGIKTKQEDRIEKAKAEASAQPSQATKAEPTRRPDVGVVVATPAPKAKEQVIEKPVSSKEEKAKAEELPVIVVEPKAETPAPKATEQPVKVTEAPKVEVSEPIIDKVIKAADEVEENTVYTVTTPDIDVVVVDFD